MALLSSKVLASNYVLVGRGRESIFVAPGAYLQQQKPCRAPKRPPKPCPRAVSLI
jgi:hypothetical protein